MKEHSKIKHRSVSSMEINHNKNTKNNNTGFLILLKFVKYNYLLRKPEFSNNIKYNIHNTIELSQIDNNISYIIYEL